MTERRVNYRTSDWRRTPMRVNIYSVSPEPRLSVSVNMINNVISADDCRTLIKMLALALDELEREQRKAAP